MQVPFCSPPDCRWETWKECGKYEEDAKISLKIVSTPKRSESDYTRDLYIDCILLKPSIDGDLSDEE